jgi:DNA-binding SARP family transcriptional activator
MTFRHFVLLLGLAVATQAAVFNRYYTDLLYLRQPVTVLAQGPVDEFRAQARSALGRQGLTRHHLDTIAETARRNGQTDIEVRALEQLAELHSADTAIALRLADALRRNGRLEEADRVYQRILAEADAQAGRRP